MPAYQVRVEEVPTGRDQLPGLAAAAWSPVPLTTPMGFGGGYSNAKAGGPKVLRPQDPPNAIPAGPLPPTCQGSVVYDGTVGAIYGGGLSYIVANVPQGPGPENEPFQWKQRQEIDPPFTSASPDGFALPQAYRPWNHIGGRAVTASPFVVQRWKVYGAS